MFFCFCCFFSPFFFSFTAITKGIDNNPFEAKKSKKKRPYSTKPQCSDSFFVKCGFVLEFGADFFLKRFLSMFLKMIFFSREGVFKVDMTNLYFFDLNDQKWCILNLVPDDIDHA